MGLDEGKCCHRRDRDEHREFLRRGGRPEFFDSIRAGTRSIDEAAALVTAFSAPWFVDRAREAT